MSEDLALPRRTRRETRELLLLAGVLATDAMVASVDEHLGRWLAHVRLEHVLQVAKRLQIFLHTSPEAGNIGEVDADWLRQHRDRILALDVSNYRDISKPTAYTVFDSQEDYRERLAARLLTRERISDGPLLIGTAEELRATLPPFSDFVATLADLEFARGRDLESMLVELGAAPYLADPTIRSLLRRRREETAHGPNGLVEFYARALEIYGLRMRHGATLQDLYAAITSLAHGLSFHARIWPESVRDHIDWGERERSVFALAVEGIIRQFTEPLEAETHEGTDQG